MSRGGDFTSANSLGLLWFFGLLWRDWWDLPVSSRISITQRSPFPLLLHGGWGGACGHRVRGEEWGEPKGALGAPNSAGFHPSKRKSQALCECSPCSGLAEERRGAVSVFRAFQWLQLLLVRQGVGYRIALFEQLIGI